MIEGTAGDLPRGSNLCLSAPGSHLKLTWLAPFLIAVGAAIIASPLRAMAMVHASIVVDAATGRVLESHNPDTQTYPASLTKLMTLYLTFAALAHGKLRRWEGARRVSPG